MINFSRRFFILKFEIDGYKQIKVPMKKDSQPTMLASRWKHDRSKKKNQK